MGKEAVLMATRKEAITSLLGTLKIRPNIISVAAAVAMLLLVMLASFGAASAEEIRFTGIVTGKNPPEQVGALWWNVTVEELIEGPQTTCDTLKVELILSPPVGSYESDIGVGARVEVWGNYTSDCTVSLNGVNYTIKRIVYPSIPGIHNGTITPFSDLTVSKLYTYQKNLL